MAKAIMIQGTGSHVGKSTVVTALCRIFSQDGYRVAPFKAQNMALNSYITRDGYEMGRAQAVQACAAGTEPRIEMNPILLKATSDLRAQVILLGKVIGNMKAREYHRFKQKAWRVIENSYAQLDSVYDLIVIEGAGSPAEVNLKAQDISNMRVARMAGAPVILVGDIDRGGVFASLVGTLELLSRGERARIAGFVINKFRGDLGLLKDGLKFLERKTHRPVLGVIPYLQDLSIEEEDGVVLNERQYLVKSVNTQHSTLKTMKIAVIHLPHISNFTDFDPLKREPDVELFYVRKKGEIAGADVIILPGSKNTIEDLFYIQRLGLDREICEAHRMGSEVIGICGGVQMLGRTIRDPQGVEGRTPQAQGLGLLAVETILASKKITAQVKAMLSDAWPVKEPVRGSAARGSGCGGIGGHFSLYPDGPPHLKTGLLSGYEIHMGRTRRLGKTQPAFTILKRNGRQVFKEDGAISPDGRIWGTYLHGLFENDPFRRCFLDRIRARKGWTHTDGWAKPISYGQEREWAFDNLARVTRKHLDLKQIYEFL